MNSFVHALVGVSPAVSILLRLTVVLAVGWALHGVLRRANPNWRVLLWRTVILGALLVPVLMPLGYFQVSVAPPEGAGGAFETGLLDDASPAAASGAVPLLDEGKPSVGAAADTSPVRFGLDGVSFLAVLRTVWIAIALALALRVAAGFLVIRRGIRASKEAPEHFQHLLSQVAVALGCTESVSLRYARDLSSPYLARMRKPVIVIPERMMDPALARELPAVLAHEVAHLRAGDLFWGRVSRWLSVVLWFHPLVWRLRDAHSTACEEVCDAVAAAYLGDAGAYSKTLARVALGCGQYPSPAAGIPMARSSQVTTRLKRLRENLHAPLARRSVVLATSLALAALVSFSGLGLVYAERPGAGPWKARILHFPEDRSMGEIQVQNWSASRSHGAFGWYNSGNVDWKRFGQARGTVVIPAGKRVRLNLSPAALNDLSPLAQLKPDDLYMLSMGWGPATDAVMPYVGKLTGLKRLDMVGTEITNAGMPAIRFLTELELLALPKGISARGLAPISELSALRVLCVADTDVGLALISRICQLRSLEELSLWQCGIDTSALAKLGELPNLREVFLGMSDFGGRGLASLSRLASLRTLDLRMCSVTDADMVYVSELRGLESLNLTNSAVTAAGIAQLKTLRRLKRLNVGGCSFGDDALAHIVEHEGLEHLQLPYRSVTDEGLAYLPQLRRLKHLRVGTSSNSPITDAGLAHFAKCGSLEDLAIGGTGITDVGLAHIAEMTNLTRLLLSFTSPEASNEGLAHLNALRKLTQLHLPMDTQMTASGLSKLSLPHLRNLQAGALGIDDQPVDVSGLLRLENLSLPEIGDEELASVASLTRLRDLGVRWMNSISDEGMAHLANLFHLERLSIGGPETTDAGLVHLADMDKLNYLFISGTFTDEGLRHLEGLKALRYLNFHESETRFSPTAIRHLRDELPMLTTLNVNKPLMGRSGRGSRSRRAARGG